MTGIPERISALLHKHTIQNSITALQQAKELVQQKDLFTDSIKNV